jgi:leader peptidase (prepilin peptidase)/N-methyltransferase
VTVLWVAWQAAAFGIGASLGSFLGLAVVRLPADRSLVRPPSRCPVCHAPVRWHDNVPILGWLVLRGRCRDCHAPIAPLHPLLEAGFGGLAWLMFRRFVPGAAALDVAHLAAFAVFTAFAWLLLCAAYVDLRARLVPEVASVYAVPVGVAGAALLGGLGYEGWLAIGWRSSVVGALAGGGGLGAVSWLWWRLAGSEGLAWGDVRLAAMIGAFVGALPGLLAVLVLASFGGAVVGLVAAVALGRPGYLPFAPVLAAAGLAWVLYGDWIGRWLLPSLGGG